MALIKNLETSPKYVDFFLKMRLKVQDESQPRFSGSGPNPKIFRVNFSHLGSFSGVMNWIMYSPNSYVEAQTPIVTVFGDRAFKKVIKIK